MKLTKIETLAKSLKISWIKRIYKSDSRWVNLYRGIVRETINEQLWNLDNRSLKAYHLKMYNPFWKQVISYWADYVKYEHFEYYKQPIWNSYFIRNENLQNIKIEMCRNGCRYILDLYDRDTNDIYTYENFCRRFQKRINILDYLSIVQSIPNTWKENTKFRLMEGNLDDRMDDMDDNFLVTGLINTTKTCKFIYWKLIEQSIEANTNYITKWCNIFHMDQTPITWNKIHLSPFYATQDTKLRTFQYKLIKRTLPTNVQLKRYGIKQYDTCEFCRNDTETYEHIFCECPFTNRIIQNLKIWLLPDLVILDENIIKCIIVGYIDLPCKKDTNLINTIFLVFKKYIYSCRCKNIIPNWHGFMSELKRMYNMEKESQHIRTREKWDILKTKLDL